MSDIKIADPKGQWYLNTALFRMYDPESNTYFEPGVPTKATKTDWLTGDGTEKLPGQVMIIEIADPSAPEVVEKAAAVAKEADIQKNGAEPDKKKQ